MPEKYQTGVSQWKKLHPSWKYTFWDEQSILKLAKFDFPEWVGYLDPGTTKLAIVERCDVARLLILLKFGGIYSDLDYAPSKSHEPLLAEFDEKLITDCAMPKEGWGHTNCWIAAKIQSRFISAYLLPRMMKRIHIEWDAINLFVLTKAYKTLWTTGPQVIEDSRRECRESAERFWSIPSATLLHEYGHHGMDGSWFGGMKDLERATLVNTLESYEQLEDYVVSVRKDYVSWSKKQPMGRNIMMLGWGTATGLLIPPQPIYALLLGLYVLFTAHTMDRLMFAMEGVPRNRMPGIVSLGAGYVLGLMVRKSIEWGSWGCKVSS